MAAPRLLAVVGPTAAGKTALAIEMARALGGEIVNADSRQVYRGMDIGTAKAPVAEREAVRHWLLDVVEPDAPFTLADYVDAARAAFDDIWSRGRLPVLAGGTGQYVWALLEGWRIPRVPPDRALRAALEAIAERDGAAALADELRRVDPDSAAAIDPSNVRRMVRAIEVTRATGRPFSAWRQRAAPAFEATVLGLRLERPTLYARIDARVEAMVAAGLVAEVRALNAAGYGCGLPALAAIGYREVCDHLAGRCDLAAAVGRIKTETHRLARMQAAWFRDGDARIRWLDGAAPAAELVAQALAVASASAS